MADLTFLCEDDPEANGATAQYGDMRYSLVFPLEDGRTLEVWMGPEGFKTVREMAERLYTESALERLVNTVEAYHANQ